MLRYALGAVVLALASLPAHAAGACSMPAELEARICAVPALARLDAALAAKEKSVAAATARPATWVGRARRFRAYLVTATDLDGRPLDTEGLGREIEDQIKLLDTELARAAALHARVDQAGVLSGKCVTDWLSPGCDVPYAGVLHGEDGQTILWQVDEGASEADGVGTGVILWDASEPGAPKLIGWTFEGGTMAMPRLGKGLLWAPGRRVGTGEGNADLLYQKRGDRWVEIDMEDWQDRLKPHLPGGRDAWHGVAYAFDGDALGATTDLWKPGDANCCATGGRANLEFAIQGERLVLTGVSAQIDGAGARWQEF